MSQAEQLYMLEQSLQYIYGKYEIVLQRINWHGTQI